MEKLKVIREQIRILQTEFDRLVENKGRDRLLSSDVAELSRKLDELIIKLQRLA